MEANGPALREPQSGPMGDGTQKTPKAELELAKKYKADYERRYCK